MAEVFGVVAGALSVVGLFKNCIDCFEYIRLGRNFGDDYERYQLRLDTAKLRLERWGTAIGINEDPRFRSLRPARTDKEVRLIRSLLRELKHVFEDIQHSERRYQIKGTVQEVDTKHRICAPINKSQRPGHLRHWQTGFFKKTTWALYDKKRFEDMMADLNRLLDDMERVLTQPVNGQELALRQPSGTTAEPSTSKSETEEDPGVAADPPAPEQKFCGIEVTNVAENIKVGQEARAHVGNVVKEQMTIQDRTNNQGGNAVVAEKARFMVGNVYGGKSIWDD
ncbi:hypothetical protein N656DRAFT_783280 [Canariomyces notabilis]|uniref:Prion-inhibition and propagation HeLo domain-containing protein n=1 Tax=Canariomyces notabilis TaxID=2074819 RepID=A0AAN6QFM2_9PEZI|nr:hypothetical protein N656DRAFT_783280 [Canariomyces arenarius]